jgi:chemotaxis protein MotB
MRGTGSVWRASGFLLTCFFFACGHSRSEWEQKVGESVELKDKLKREQRARMKAEADYADTVEEMEALRAKLSARATSIDSMEASLEAQNRALTEFQHRTSQLLEIQHRFDALRARLQKLTQIGLTVVVRGNRVVIQLPGDVLFDSGSDKLKPSGEGILLQIGDVIRADSELLVREFQVAGHTDGFALQGGMFRDNWGLSAMRARSVLVLLTRSIAEGGAGLDQSKWSAAGYGSTDPVATNQTSEGRSQNRRVELVVQPEVAEMLNLESLDAGTSPHEDGGDLDDP